MSAMELKLTTTDGTEHEVSVLFADLAKYDVLRARNNFPKREEGEFVFLAVVAYCALVRTGAVANTVKPDAFIETIAAIDPVEDEAEETDPEADFRKSDGTD